MSISDEYLQLQADHAAAHKEAHGNLDNWRESWALIEPEMLVVARDQNLRKGKEFRKQQEANEAEAAKAAVTSLRRSEMDTEQKAAFVGEHGLEAFQALPA